MNSEMTNVFFALIRSAIRGEKLSGSERDALSSANLRDLFVLADKHDVAHLIVFALKENGLSTEAFEKMLFKAIYKYDRMNLEFTRLTTALEDAKIPFIPLKGSVIRKYYPHPWMRTSCDIDIFVDEGNLENAISVLTEKCGYECGEKGPHDIPLCTSNGTRIELHYRLVEEARANEAASVLSLVWENATVCEGYGYRYEMSDAFFYFYHIAHMAKHFETGGCGIRPFIDLWILDGLEKADKEGREKLLSEGNLLKFAENSRNLSEVWLGGREADEFSLQMQNFIFGGGVYGSPENRVVLQQKKMGGRTGYLMSRVFASKSKLKGDYPILEKHPWLLPFMQVRRWLMLFRPDVAKMAKGEMSANKSLDKSKTEEMNAFLNNIGL